MEVVHGLNSTDFALPRLGWPLSLLSGQQQEPVPIPQDDTFPWGGSASHFLASPLHWTPAIMEELLCPPWNDALSKYIFAFPACGASSSTAIDRLRDLRIYCIPHNMASNQWIHFTPKVGQWAPPCPITKKQLACRSGGFIRDPLGTIPFDAGVLAYKMCVCIKPTNKYGTIFPTCRIHGPEHQQ